MAANTDTHISVAIRTAESMEEGADLKGGIIEEPVSLVHHQTAAAARRSMSKSPPQTVSPKQTTSFYFN